MTKQIPNNPKSITKNFKKEQTIALEKLFYKSLYEEEQENKSEKRSEIKRRSLAKKAARETVEKIWKSGTLSEWAKKDLLPETTDLVTYKTVLNSAQKELSLLTDLKSKLEAMKDNIESSIKNDTELNLDNFREEMKKIKCIEPEVEISSSITGRSTSDIVKDAENLLLEIEEDKKKFHEINESLKPSENTTQKFQLEQEAHLTNIANLLEKIKIMALDNSHELNEDISYYSKHRDELTDNTVLLFKARCDFIKEYEFKIARLLSIQNNNKKLDGKSLDSLQLSGNNLINLIDNKLKLILQRLSKELNIDIEIKNINPESIIFYGKSNEAQELSNTPETRIDKIKNELSSAFRPEETRDYIYQEQKNESIKNKLVNLMNDFFIKKDHLSFDDAQKYMLQMETGYYELIDGEYNSHLEMMKLLREDQAENQIFSNNEKTEH